MADYDVPEETSKSLALELHEEYCELVRRILPHYRGRELATDGQALSAVFNTPVQALQCVVKIQRAAFERSFSTSRERRFAPRIGVHFGEVTANRAQASGDGLTLAIHIAALAEPGGIYLSKETVRQLGNDFYLPITAVSKRRLKNVKLPTALYCVALPWNQRRRKKQDQNREHAGTSPGIEYSVSSDQREAEPRASVLLKTKLTPPLTRTGIVPRQRLIDRLNRGLDGRWTLIAAPAGFGKTTLLTEWISQSSRPAGWLSLDELDNHPSRFWEYFVGALQALHPYLGENAHALLAAQLRQARPFCPDAFLTPLVNELSAVKDPIVLVVDDFHFITNPGITEGFIFLLEHLPAQVHVILTGRADPQLPLARMRARNQMNELRALDLRFTTDEAAAFLNQVMNLHLSSESIAVLEARTEGWIVGLQFAALSVQRLDAEGRRSFIKAFAGSHRYIVDYLAEEVFNTQPENVKRFLLLTSVLNRLNGSLCDAVTGGNDGEAMLASLARNNLFTMPLDEQGQWYRYHQLFADVLRHQLQRTHPALVPDLHCRASIWFEQHGLVAEAMNHALAAPDHEIAARLLETSGGSMIKQGQTITLLGWLDALPQEMVRSRPRLSILKAWAAVSQDRMQEATEFLADAERWALHEEATNPQARSVLGEVAAVRAMMGVMLDDAPAIFDAAKKALDYLPREQKYLRGLVTMNFAVANLLVGDFSEARRADEEALREGHKMGNRTLLYFGYFCQAGIERMQSNLPRAADALRKALEAAQTQDGGYLPIATLAHRYLAEILYDWNDLESAFRHITLAVELGQSWWVRDEMIKSYMLLARIQEARGNHDVVGNALKQAEELANDRYVFNLLGQVGVPSLKRWLANGCLQRVVRWEAEKSPSTASEALLTVHQGGAGTSLARLSLVREDPALALATLKPLLEAVERKQITATMIEALVLQALALQMREDIQGALDSLNRALSLARPGGYIRTFLDEGDAMQSLLHRVTGVNRRYAASLMYVLDLRENLSAPVKERTEIADASGSTLVEPLSRRELEVIPLLAEGLSNLEVARKLHISMDTVKVHLRHIYQKLGVNNRSKAAIRARELSLL